MAVAVGVGVSLTEPVAVTGVMPTLAASPSKNMTTSNAGRLPVPHGMASRRSRALPSCDAVVFSLLELESETRVTPSMSRRRAIRRATWVWPGAQPVRVMAGAEIALRSEPPWPPASVAMSPLSWRSVTSCGMARDRSRSVCSQSKREPARSRTVCTRALAAASKSAYGLSLVTWACIACCCWATWSRSALRCLMVLSVRTRPATPTTQAASTPRTTNAPAPPLASGPTASSADDLDAPRVSGGRRLTALTSLVSAHAVAS